MSPVKLTIPGRYWDTQIYQGRLYLFSVDGSILTLDWDRLIQGIPIDTSLKLALMCAFTRGDYLYRVAGTGILHDEEFKAIMNRRFWTLAETSLVVAEKDINRALLGQQDDLFPFPHTDSTIYYQRLYVASQSGVFAAGCSGRTKYPVSSRVKKLWDCPVLALSASYKCLALAAGGEGLWEYSLDTRFDPSSSERSGINSHIGNHFAERYCNECQWAFYSIYGSSARGSGFLAAYHKTRAGSRVYSREFHELISEEKIFPDSEDAVGAYSWAAQDKICRAANGSIRVAKYQPWDEETPVQQIGFLSLERHGETIVSAKVAMFGTVVELDSSLVVISSDGANCSIDGEPVSWRVFPRSRHYENHLHVIYDDHLEIFSFNHDYLVDQRTKISGVSSMFPDGRSSFDSLGLS